MSSDECEECPCCEVPCEDGEGLLCAGCNRSYHFGKCSNITKSKYKSKGEAWRKSWQCQTCKGKKSKDSQGEKPENQGVNVASLMLAVNEKLEGLMTLKTTVENIEQSVNMMSSKYDEILAHIRTQDKEVKQLKHRVEAIEQREKAYRTDEIAQELHELELHSRKLNLEFHGLPVTENEDLLSKINAVAEKLHLPQLADSDIVAVHRLPSAKEKVPGVIVRFAQQATRNSFLEKKNVLRNCDSCYILENLTKKNRLLLATTKVWARNHGYKYAWHKNGKVYLRQKDGEKAIRVRNESELDSVG